jgi:hypothetical protein
MLPEAKRENLLYVADAGTGKKAGVDVFSYPGLKRVGKLRNGYRPFGECVDAGDDVYVVDGPKVVEYAHGSLTPIRTINGPSPSNGYNWSCAVDLTSGNLAVTTNGYLESGYVYVYAGASGMPTRYEPDMAQPVDPAYDQRGDLFVLGEGNSRQAELAELPWEAGALVPIGIRKRADVSWIGGLVCNDGELVIGETRADDARYALRGKNDRRVWRTGQTPLPGAGNYHTGFSIQTGRLIQPATSAVFIYAYPGGNRVGEIDGFGEPLAAVVSLAPTRRGR